MIKDKNKFKTRLILAAIAVALLSGAYYGYSRYQQHKRDQYLASLSSDPRKVFQAVSEKKITDEEAGKAMEPIVQDRIARMQKYFEIPEGPQRTKYLDSLIDEMERRRAEFEKDRAKQASAQPSTTQPTGAPTSQPAAPNWRERMAGRMQSMPPQQRAQAAEFISAMVKRRAERGLPMGPGPGGMPMGGPPRG